MSSSISFFSTLFHSMVTSLPNMSSCLLVFPCYKGPAASFSENERKNEKKETREKPQGLRALACSSRVPWVKEFSFQHLYQRAYNCLWLQFLRSDNFFWPQKGTTVMCIYPYPPSPQHTQRMKNNKGKRSEKRSPSLLGHRKSRSGFPALFLLSHPHTPSKYPYVSSTMSSPFHTELCNLLLRGIGK